MSFDAHKNLAYSTVATAPSPAASGGSLVIFAGDGAKFPAASFNAVVWPVNTQPTTTNAEIVRVTVVATDTFTITRAQEGSAARTILVGDQISAPLTAKGLTDIETALNLTATALVIGNGAGGPTVEANALIEQTGHTLTFGTQPRARATNSVAQVVSNNTETALTFDTNVDAVPAAIHSTSSNTSRFVVPAGAGGFYMFIGSAMFAANATGVRLMYLKKNGMTAISNNVCNPNNAAGSVTSLQCEGFATLVAGDYVEIIVLQTSGGNLNVGGTAFGVTGINVFEMVKLW